MSNITESKIALESFYENAKNQALATEQGDYKIGNKNVEKIHEAVIYLKNNNEINKLIDFLKDDSVGVRLWAASYLLPVCETESIYVLKNIANENNIHSLTASTTLNEWKKGSLKL